MVSILKEKKIKIRKCFREILTNKTKLEKETKKKHRLVEKADCFFCRRTRHVYRTVILLEKGKEKYNTAKLLD